MTFPKESRSGSYHFFAPAGVKFWLYCIEAMVVGFGYSLFYMVVTICLMNTIEYNEYKTGSRNEGMSLSVPGTEAARYFLFNSRNLAVFQMLGVGLGIVIIAAAVGDEEIVVRVGGVKCRVYRVNARIGYRS